MNLALNGQAPGVYNLTVQLTSQVPGLLTPTLLALRAIRRGNSKSASLAMEWADNLRGNCSGPQHLSEFLRHLVYQMAMERLHQASRSTGDKVLQEFLRNGLDLNIKAWEVLIRRN